MAHSIDRGHEISSLEAGKKAGIIIFDKSNQKMFAYNYRVNLAEKVFKDGKLVVEKGKKL
ncbi:MAG: hypothetical protein ACFFCQ_12280 [Promethearchaeota archaeon]